MSINRCYNVADFRRLAAKKLPPSIFHYIDGGSDDEISQRRNTAAFDDIELMPRCLRDVSRIDTAVTVLGAKLDWPVFLSPTGASRLFHHHKELGVARAAAKVGTLYSLSTAGTATIEQVAEVCSGPKMFQLYVYKDRGLTRESSSSAARPPITTPSESPSIHPSPVIANGTSFMVCRCRRNSACAISQVSRCTSAGR